MSDILRGTSMRIKNILLAGILSAICIVGYGQNLGQFISAAEKSFQGEDYYSALSYYLEAIQFDTTDLDVSYNVAESARLFDSYNISKDYYSRVVALDENNNYPLAPFYLGEMSQITGDYESAITYYKLYLSEQEGEDEYLTAKAQKEISSAEWSLEMADNIQENISVRRFGDDVNTEFSEFGAIRSEDGLTYSSLAFQTEEEKNIPTKAISKIVKSTADGMVDSYVELNRPNLNTAHTTYNTNKSRIYYTICNYINATDIRCDLYSRAILGDGSYGEETKLPDHINGDTHTSTQPTVAFDQSLGKEVLYFSSDRAGGEGKMDLWYVTLDGLDKYSDPINLSILNTAEDDITPFYHANSQVLYFSSEGYTSLGGFDIYRAPKDNGTFGEVENLGLPINSSYNDVYYNLDDDGESALFSSNRTGTKYVDELNESCCYDIFESDIENVEINLNALTFDANTLDTLTDVKVDLVCADNGQIMDTRTNSAGADHSFSLERGKEYLVISSKDGYTPDTMRLNTNRIYSSEDIVRKVFLKRNSLDLLVYTYDDISKLALPGTTVKLIDLTDGSIQEKLITNEEGNDFTFNVIPGHEYQIIGFRDRYGEASTMFKAIDEDGTGVITRKLYLERRDLNIYLPLALYFDNDEPNKRSVSLTTDKDYTETFDEYIFRKQQFKDEYTKGMSETDKGLGESRLEDFFENDVKNGYNNYQQFLQAMLKQLDKGRTFELSIRGFASPRADTRYNLALSQRRVISVENDIRTFAGGALTTFIDNGQLKITQLSYGENLAPEGISDVFRDRRNSIYSPEASKERRVEIVEIKTQLFNE